MNRVEQTARRFALSVQQWPYLEGCHMLILILQGFLGHIKDTGMKLVISKLLTQENSFKIVISLFGSKQALTGLCICHNTGD